MSEYKRVREQIARIRCLHCEEYSHHKEACLLTPNVTPFCPEALSIAGQILSLNGIEIKSDDQSLPNADRLKAELKKQGGYHTARTKAYVFAQIDMLKPDSEGRVWKKVAPKEE